MIAALRVLLLAVLALALAACTAVERAALPAPEPLGPRWAEFAAPPGAALDHAPWDGFLARYRSIGVDGIARVDYGAVTPEDRRALGGYIAALAAADPATLTRADALAYWINLYNAVTVAVVLDAWPVASIRDITDGPFSFGPWSRPVVSVAGTALSLNDIEHRIVRPVFREPRIHYALNCAALGCPNLGAAAWRGATLEADLAAAERAYLADPRGIRVTPEGELVLSKIFAWFREDFGADEAAVLAYLAERAPEPALLVERSGPVRYDYDWGLNAAAPP